MVPAKVASVFVLATACLAALVAPSFATHPRPKGAEPFRASLVPAFEPCTAPDRTHGPPLAFPSCSNTQQASDFLTVGNPPASAARFVGSVKIVVFAGTPGPPDDNVVIVTTDVTDVRCQGMSGGCTGAGADYAGSLRLEITLRITDHWNSTDGFGGPDPATVQDPVTMPVTVGCVQTSDPAIGSSCHAETAHWNIFGPGYPVKDDKRTIWEFGQAGYYDGGTDGDGNTTADNTVFLRQGIFIP